MIRYGLLEMDRATGFWGWHGEGRSEDQLMAKPVARSFEVAFGDLYRLAYQVAYRILGDRAKAEDPGLDLRVRRRPLAHRRREHLAAARHDMSAVAQRCGAAPSLIHRTRRVQGGRPLFSPRGSTTTLARCHQPPPVGWGAA